MAVPHQDEATCLLIQLQQGHAEVFDLFYQRTSPRVRQFIQRRIFQSGQIEDLVQEVYLTAWQTCSSFQARSMAETWLLGIARNVILRHLQRGKSLQQRNKTAHNIKDECATTDHALDRANLQHDIQILLARLPSAQREAVELAYFSGLSWAEAACQIKCSTTQFRDRVYEGRMRLRGWLR